MDTQLTPVVVGVRFSKVGKIYHFDASHIPDLQLGDSVVVETSRGWQIGTVAQMLPTPDSPGGLKEVDRRATPRDLMLHQSWQAKQKDVWAAASARAKELNLQGVKVIAAEYTYDGSRLSIIYSSETDEKPELKSLRQDMGRAFAPAQVEMRQIGPRDVAKLLGGMGACGLEQRCCSQFLCEFNSISIKMAKEQGISLTPSEITGMCGRLRCCLSYEFQQYTEMRAALPRRNKHVMTPDGEARVLDQIPLREALLVEYPDGLRKEIAFAEVQVMDESGNYPPPPPKPAAPTPVETSAIDAERPDQVAPPWAERRGERPPQAEGRPSGGGQPSGEGRRDQRERRGPRPPRQGQSPQPGQRTSHQPPADQQKPPANQQPASQDGQSTRDGRRRPHRRRGGASRGNNGGTNKPDTTT